MGATIYQMREWLKKRYSPAFAKRVDNMHDDQVLAIYYKVRLSDRGMKAMSRTPETHVNNQTVPVDPYIQDALF